MTLRDKPAGLLSRLRHPRTTVRWRLTLLYGGLFLVSGAALLAVTYTLVANSTVTNGPSLQRTVLYAGKGATPLGLPGPPNFNLTVRPGPRANASAGTVRSIRNASRGGSIRLPNQVKHFLGSNAGREVFVTVGSEQRVADLHQLVIWSSIALAIMAVISGALGWMVAGRVLRPLRTMTATTQQISEANLHQRLALQGPRDELRRLADTIDGLLERLEGAFDAQRRFVANASHELRTPLTAARAMLEMIISDPHATVESFRQTCAHVLEEGEHQEELIDALLALAQGQRGIDRREAVDLAAVVGAVVRSHELDAAARGLALEVSLEPATISGDQRLIDRLVCNLVENAIRHNIPHGRVHVLVDTQRVRARLAVTNTGPAVPAEEVDRLLQPFQRLARDRVGHREGLGLGLSIVAAIASAHNASLDVHPGALGGLDVEVRFPLAREEPPRPDGTPGRTQTVDELPDLPADPVEVSPA